MEKYQAGDKELTFAGIIWDEEPVPSGRLVELASEQLGWAKSTTYTVLRRLIDRGLVENTNGIITSKVSRSEFSTGQSRQFVTRNFGGSLPRFLNAFSDGITLPEEDIEALEDLIRKWRQHDE